MRTARLLTTVVNCGKDIAVRSVAPTEGGKTNAL